MVEERERSSRKCKLQKNIKFHSAIHANSWNCRARLENARSRDQIREAKTRTSYINKILYKALLLILLSSTIFYRWHDEHLDYIQRNDIEEGKFDLVSIIRLYQYQQDSFLFDIRIAFSKLRRFRVRVSSCCMTSAYSQLFLCGFFPSLICVSFCVT